MTHPPLKIFAARRSPQGGFTLVELLVVIGIIAILAGVALGPITHGLETAKESAGMQTARTIALAEFQYQTDNSNYPGGTAKSGYIAGQLVAGGYITDVSLFSKDKSSAYTGDTSSATAVTSGLDTTSTICWDFMEGPSNAGLTSSDPDSLPLVFSTGQTVTPAPTTYSTTGITINTANTNPFGNNGMAVCFKSNSAVFLKAVKTGTSSYQVQTNANNALYGPSFAGPATYTQAEP
jgi:prepilin-type N-terminal cleavage/methylation domain-containing protein